jgi:lipopolysaccharide biosynthesis glycosyltransferase
MNVGFYLTGTAPSWTALMVQSVRQHMPTVPIFQLTDETSTALQGIDGALRLPPAPLSLHRARHFANTQGKWLFIDTDVIVQRDVSNVFDWDFDIAVADRQWTKAPNGQYRAGGQPDYVERFPYNAGVVFSRCPRFFSDIVRMLTMRQDLQQSWVGDQLALCDLVKAKRYAVKVLPGMIYNFPPESANDPDIKNAAIVHYKGKARKPFLVQRAKAVAA